MRWVVPLLLMVASGCDGSRAVGVDGGGSASDSSGPCDCVGVTSPLGGTVNGQPLTFDHTYYGITVTWGTHAKPVSPAEATGLRLLLTNHQVTCSEMGSFPVDVGPLLDVRIKAKTSQQIYGAWIPSKEQWTNVDGEVCLQSVPLKERDPVGRNPTISGSIPGCATLRLTRYGKSIGQVSGHFAALRCPMLDSAFGE